MRLRCWLGHHDWEGLPRDAGCLTSRVCLRCHQRDVFTSIGGGWGGWQEIGDFERQREARMERQRRAKRIADTFADTSTGAL
jgi:hypothetical protein